jgi:hypothetical protein
MRSLFVGLVVVVFLLAAPLGFCAETTRSPIEVSEFSTVVASPEIKAPLTNKDLNACIREAARAMKLENQEHPQIVILQISPTEAKRLGISQTVLLSNRGKTPPNAFYEVWLVGPSAMADLVRSVEMVYELHFGLHYSDVDRGKMVKRIASLVGGTISVNGLREENEKPESR